MRPSSLLAIPTWNQLRDPLPDGEGVPLSPDECGEECAAMRIYYRTGIALPADLLRQMLPGHAGGAKTTASDLVAIMRIFGLHPVATPLGPDAVRANLIRSIESKTPPLVLGYFEGPNVLHWVLGVAYNPTGILVNDPWGGTRRLIYWSALTSQYAGWVIL